MHLITIIVLIVGAINLCFARHYRKQADRFHTLAEAEKTRYHLTSNQLHGGNNE